MPRMSSLFGRSPIRPTQRHMGAAVACARDVRPLVEARAAGDLAAIAESRTEIARLEHEADEIKNEIRSRLMRGFFMRVSRRDRHEILDHQDSIAEAAQDVAELAGYAERVGNRLGLLIAG